MPTPRKNQGQVAHLGAKDVDYGESARRALKTIITTRSFTYADLVERLAAIGVIETETSIAQKIRRGSFQMAFFFQCLRAMDIEQVTLTIPSAEPSRDAHA
ncbi:hypothetical protein J2778_004917 [Paraburkholderia graminis]|uniref:DUF6471 domain-containing protein n=1 Tax=Paraburkholderia graminis TaxID=60548 RepID=UPI002866F7F0|nr:DUF6471 domain-containing protein [Paraburkholderia graminis]MDR6477412.1 hypothetical protein [Paraburkholderia graminis]